MVLNHNMLLHHIDDIIVHRGTNGVPISFSPDAAEHYIQLDAGEVELDAWRFSSSYIAEIKAYNAADHILAYWDNMVDRNERWQIAMAMLVAPSILNGILLFYNPEVEDFPLHYKLYKRIDLDDEINQCDQIAAWLQECKNVMLAEIAQSPVSHLACTKESEIIAELEKEAALDVR